MDDYEPYSKRLKQRERSSLPATYRYDVLPDEFRVQAYYALVSAVGEYEWVPTYTLGTQHAVPPQNIVWGQIEEAVKRERGTDSLSLKTGNAQSHFLDYFRTELDSNRVLDAIEIAFRAAVQHRDAGSSGAYPNVSTAINGLNRRFRQHDLGYQFNVQANGGIIMRVDSEFVHSEIVEPAILALDRQGFTGALDEFLKAHEEYRHGHNKDAMNEARKAFESVLKSICTAKNWPYTEGANASHLVSLVLDKELLPKSLESYLGGVRTILTSGVPTLRNKSSGHGQGPVIREVPDHLAAFALHLTASNIVFLMSAYDASL